MAYIPTVWKNRVVEKPRTYTLQDNGDGTVTLIPAPGVVTEEGTPVNAANLNKIEQGIEDAMPKSGGEFTGAVKTKPSSGTVDSMSYLGATFMVEGETTEDDAFIAFHIPGVYGAKFGLNNVTKRLMIGGWSIGTGIKHRIWDERDLRVSNGVLQFYDGGVWKPVGGVKNVQRGTVALPGGSATFDVTISPVTVAKSLVVTTFIPAFGTASSWGTAWDVELINATTLRFTRRATMTADGVTVSWQVVEHI